MKIQSKATGILEVTSHYMRSGALTNKPAWFDVVGANPPNPDLAKKPKLFDVNAQKQDPRNGLFKQSRSNKLFKTRTSKKDQEQQNNSVSRVPRLTFVEDRLRDVFYHQHPWEFSRPKNLIENAGDDFTKCDWSHMLQFHKPLDGESVVQRTLWLLTSSGKRGKSALFEAYDQARFEFYRLRMEEEMSSSVSREESAMFGAIYPSTNMEWGVGKEQEQIDVWAKVAAEKTTIKSAARAGKQTAKNGSQGGSVLEEQSTSIWDQGFEGFDEVAVENPEESK